MCAVYDGNDCGFVLHSRLPRLWGGVDGGYAEQLLCEREPGNVVDRYAMAVKKDSGVTIGHLPQKISRMCSMFTQRGGETTATVTGHEESSLDTKISRDQQIIAFTKTMQILILRIVPNAILKSSHKKPAIRRVGGNLVTVT